MLRIGYEDAGWEAVICLPETIPVGFFSDSTSQKLSLKILIQRGDVHPTARQERTASKKRTSAAGRPDTLYWQFFLMKLFSKVTCAHIPCAFQSGSKLCRPSCSRSQNRKFPSGWNPHTLPAGHFQSCGTVSFHAPAVPYVWKQYREALLRTSRFQSGIND